MNCPPPYSSWDGYVSFYDYDAMTPRQREVVRQRWEQDGARDQYEALQRAARQLEATGKLAIMHDDLVRREASRLKMAKEEEARRLILPAPKKRAKAKAKAQPKPKKTKEQRTARKTSRKKIVHPAPLKET